MSEEKKLNFTLPEGVTELIIREGVAVKQLDPKEPIKIDIKGSIESPFRFLEKRLNVIEEYGPQINIGSACLLVQRSKTTITLVINEYDYYTRGVVVGSLIEHPKFKEFGINSSEKTWEPNQLGQFLKMNRAFFLNKEENMELVAVLKNFNAKVNANIEKVKNESGTFADNYSAVVESNLPGSFKINLPLFIGMSAEEFEVEFYASVNGRSFSLQLVSPGACESLEKIRDEVINKELEKILTIAPALVVIEQ
jgi:hypothetical protein